MSILSSKTLPATEQAHGMPLAGLQAPPHCSSLRSHTQELLSRNEALAAQTEAYSFKATVWWWEEQACLSVLS